jgi:xylose isomerase
MNRNDYQSGWDTDQFPNNVPEMALAYYQVLQAGGFTTGGTNFDAKLRRQSLDAEDLLIGHIGGMDCCARGLKAAAKMVEDKALSGPLANRYAGWDKAENQKMLRGEESLEAIAARVEAQNVNPKPVSGKQELLENVVNRYV